MKTRTYQTGICTVLLAFAMTTQAMTLYYNDFETSAGTEWSAQTLDVTPIGARQFLGQFGNESVTLHLKNLPPHRSVRISFELFVIRSWDGSNRFGSNEGPDLWELILDDSRTLIRTSFDNHTPPLYAAPERQTFPAAYGQGWHPAQSGAAEKNTLGYYEDIDSELPSDSVYAMTVDCVHDSCDLSLTFSGLCQPMPAHLLDESWGLDNVVIELTDVNGQVLLDVTSTSGGSVVSGTGTHWVNQGNTLNLEAKAEPDFVFDHWSGTAVEQGFVANPFSPVTSLRADSASFLKAHFVGDPGASVLVVDDAAIHDPGPGDPLISDPLEDGSLTHPFDSIQEAVNRLNTKQHKAVLVLSGVYQGIGNRNIDLKGKRTMLHSVAGPENCIIDCERQGRGFIIQNGEGRNTLIKGFTIQSGSEDIGGGVYCQAGATFSQCVFSNNTASVQGDAIYCAGGYPFFYDCTVTNCGDQAVTVANGTITLGGLIKTDTTALTGSGQIIIPTGAVLETTQCTVGCNLTGSGWINAAGGLTVSGQGSIQLSKPSTQGPLVSGTLLCEGLLTLKDQAAISYAHVEMSHCLITGQGELIHSMIQIQKPLVYGQFLVNEKADLNYNLIQAQSDNFLTFGDSFTGSVTGNAVELTLTGEQVLEVRGLGLDYNQGEGGVQMGTVSSVFDRSLWQFKDLRLAENAIVTLQDRFDDQKNGLTESLYVQTLTLGPNTELNCMGLNILTEIYTSDPTSKVSQGPLYGQSLGLIDFEDPTEFAARIQAGDNQGVSFEEGTMQLTSQNQEPIQAKAWFDRCQEDRALIRFRYRFNSNDVVLVVYLSDSPEVGNRDPLRIREVARLHAPAPGRPGSVGSTRIGEFEREISTAGLDLTQGTWVELEMITQNEPPTVFSGPVEILSESRPGTASVSIDDWCVEIHCSGICMDFNDDTLVDTLDFEMVLCVMGGAVPVSGDGNRCFDGIFSRDGYIDIWDMISWDWLFQCDGCSNLCIKMTDIPLINVDATDQRFRVNSEAVRIQSSLPGPTEPENIPKGLTILDKLFYSTPESVFTHFGDHLHIKRDNGAWDTYRPKHLSDQLHFKLIQSDTGEINVIDFNGVKDLWNTEVISPASHANIIEPRYGSDATVTLGIHDTSGNLWGRPILDAVIQENAMYVVPVVVHPKDREPYMAAARLSAHEDIEQIYDDFSSDFTQSPALDNPNLTGLREIEVDEQGNVYVLNVHRLNSSTILWKYGPMGNVLCYQELDTLGIADPIGLCVVQGLDDAIYVASARSDPNNPQTARLYCLSQEDLQVQRTIQINGMQQVTAMTEQGQTGIVWVVGTTLSTLPERLDLYNPPTYSSWIAEVKPQDKQVNAQSLIHQNGEIILPMSIIWTEP